MRWRTWPVVGLISGLFATPASSAELLKDGAELTLDFTDQGLCFIHPIELRRAEACVGMAPEKATVPTDPDDLYLALALKRLPNQDLLFVNVARAKPTDPPTPSTLNRRRDDFATGAASAMPKGSQIREKKAEIVRWGGADGLQVTIEASGSTDPVARTIEHSKTFIPSAETASYIISVTGPQSSKAEVDALFDSLLHTLVVAHPARPISESLAYRAGQLSVRIVMVVGVIIALLILQRQRKKSRQR